MGLLTPRGPEAAKASLEDGLNTALRTSVRLQSVLSKVPPGELSALTPLRVYSIDCSKVLGNNWRQEVAATGWFYVLLAEEPTASPAQKIPVALAELVDAGEGYRLRGVAVDRDKKKSSVAEVYRAVNKANEWAKADPEPCELRVLKIGMIYMTSLWLKGASLDKDRFIILSPKIRPFAPLEELWAGAFIEKVSTLCARAQRPAVFGPVPTQ